MPLKSGSAKVDVIKSRHGLSFPRLGGIFDDSQHAFSQALTSWPRKARATRKHISDPGPHHIALCHDRTGDSRVSAFHAGLFAFRSSTGDAPPDGVNSCWPRDAALAWLCRDLTICPDILKVLKSGPKPLYYGGRDRWPSRWNEEDSYTIPSAHSIIYLEDFIPERSDEQEAAMKSFLDEIMLQTGTRCEFRSIQEDWKESAPVEEEDLQKYMCNLTSHGQKDDPPQKHSDVFRDWFISTYMKDDTNIVALHIDKVEARYHDQPAGEKDPVAPGLRSRFLSVILDAPELAIPVCQLPYESQVTKKQEQLPFVVSFMGAPGPRDRCPPHRLDTGGIDEVQTRQSKARKERFRD